MKTAILSTPPNLLASPRIDFLEDSFQSLVFNKGYNVTIEPAFPCPCTYRKQAAQSLCLNCQGTGLVFGTPQQCKAVIQSINRSSKYKEWTEALIGTANITIEQRFKMALLDKITVIDSESVFAENLLVREMTSDAKLFAVSCYPIKEVDLLFKFVSPREPLLRIEDFTVEDNKIVFGDHTVKGGDSISVRYTHNVQYLVIDMNHDIRNSYYLDDSSKEVQNRLPVSAVIRRLHCLMDGTNFAKNNLLYNPTL